MKDKKNKIGKYLYECRKNANLTLRKAEELSGVSNAYISMLENAKRNEPHPRILLKLANAYKANYYDMMMICGYIGFGSIKEYIEERY